MILEAKHHFFIYPFFKWYSGYIIKRNFYSTRIIAGSDLPDGPVLLLSNHFSWWDGFFAMHANRSLLNRKFYFMMLEEQLRKFRFFNYAGGFSVARKKRSIIESLQYASGLLDDYNNLLLVFPQGRIQSMHRHHFEFEKGIERILQGKEDTVRVVFLAILTDWFSHKKPSVMMYLEKYTGNDFRIASINHHYNAFFSGAIKQQLNIGDL